MFGDRGFADVVEQPGDPEVVDQALGHAERFGLRHSQDRDVDRVRERVLVVGLQGGERHEGRQIREEIFLDHAHDPLDVVRDQPLDRVPPIEDLMEQLHLAAEVVPRTGGLRTRPNSHVQFAHLDVRQARCATGQEAFREREELLAGEAGRQNDQFDALGLELGLEVVRDHLHFRVADVVDEQPVVAHHDPDLRPAVEEAGEALRQLGDGFLELRVTGGVERAAAQDAADLLEQTVPRIGRHGGERPFRQRGHDRPFSRPPRTSAAPPEPPCGPRRSRGSRR